RHSRAPIPPRHAVCRGHEAVPALPPRPPFRCQSLPQLQCGKCTHTHTQTHTHTHSHTHRHTHAHTHTHTHTRTHTRTHTHTHTLCTWDLTVCFTRRDSPDST